jgi:hypothetical protein
MVVLGVLVSVFTVYVASPGEAGASRVQDSEFCLIDDANRLAVTAGLPDDLRNGVRLLTNHRSVESGEVVIARLANLSATTVVSGSEFEIQRRNGPEWETDLSSPDGPWPRSARKLEPGEVAGCYRYLVPDGQPAGEYRFLTSIAERTELSSRNWVKLAEFVVREPDSETARQVRPAPSQCRDATEVDYEAPLAGLPPLSPNSSGEDLAIGPPRLRLFPVGDRLTVGSDRFGFELGIDRQTIRQPVVLDGYTELELDRVNRRGRVVKAVTAKREALGVVAGPGFNGQPFVVRVPAKPGLYLFRALLRDEQGAAVGRYADYLRVLRPVTKVRLMADGGPVGPGSVTRFWIENRGTRAVDPLGREFAVEVFEGGLWSKAPISPRGFPKGKAKPLPAGASGGCVFFSIPLEAHPGLYRFSKDVVLESGRKRRLTAEFEISSEAGQLTPRPRATDLASGRTPGRRPSG